MKLRPITSAVLLSLSLMAVTAVHAQEERRSYIVQLADKPVATYEGDVAGLAATKPPTGQRLNVDASDVQAYISYLDAKQADVMSTIASAEITNEFKVVFNGFSAMLTDAEVRALKKNSKVAAITADSILQLDTSYTPGFIGVDGPNGLWSKLGGQGAAGENMIIGIIDSGIWPEHVSFADRIDTATNTPSHTGDMQVYSAPPAGWKGACEVGEGFSQANCNNKLIGARSFKTATQTFHWTEFNSARDSVAGAEGSGGHGTHTASTAGGNAGSPAIINGLNLGKVSGIAPRARIAAYKVCWTSAAGSNGCATSNSVAAVEAAVKDGVNVINFSIGPNAGGGTFSEATEQAFLGAAAAGVFVATSAGNGGPGATNVTPTAHLSPWLTSVGNTSHNRLYVGDAELGNGVKITGASSNAKNAPTQLILARDAGKEGVDPNNVNLNRCFGAADTVSPTVLLDPIKVAGKILVCDRGDNVLVNKSANAKAAGAAGVIITNAFATATLPATANTIINQAHTLSTIHVTAEEGTKLKSYIAANPGSAVASMGNLRATLDTTVNAPVMSASSSRGPNVANANILKPDVSAPGSDILAAVTADLTKDERNAVALGGTSPSSNFAFYSGTSMASPHIAGMAALLKQSHPTWTPAMIKSALMTTAMDVFGDTQNGAQAWDPTARFNGNLPWGQGAGFARPTLANDPGLVYDAGLPDYIRFMCGANVLVPTSAACTTNGSIQPFDLNLASLTVADMLGVQTLKRTVTNVGPAGTYTPIVTLAGFNVVVEPASLTLAEGQKADYTVKLTRTTAPFNSWVYGKLTWTDGTRSVRSPLTVRASSMVAAPMVTSEATSGSKFLTIGTGFAGTMTVAKAGLIPATQDSATVLQAPSLVSATNRTICANGGGTGVSAHNFVVPTGTRLIRFATYDEDTSGNGGSDLDLIVLRMAGTTPPLAGSSGNNTSNESVQVLNPVAGTYRVCVIGYAPKNGADTYKLSSWILSPTAVGGNLKASAPSKVVAGGTATVGIAWSGLPVGKRHLGVLTYQTGTTVVGNTVLEVDTTDPLPLFQNARSAPVLAE